MIFWADTRHLRCLLHSFRTVFQRFQLNIQVKGAIGYDFHIGLVRLISGRFNPKIMLTVENGIAVSLGSEVAGTSNEHSIDVHKSLCRVDLENQVGRIGSYNLRIDRANKIQKIYFLACCGVGVGHCSLILPGMKRRGINRGS